MTPVALIAVLSSATVMNPMNKPSTTRWMMKKDPIDYFFRLPKKDRLGIILFISLLILWLLR